MVTPLPGKWNTSRSILVPSSPTNVSDSYRFRDHPELVSAFNASLSKVGSLRCDILLSPHPSASDMRARLLSGSLLGTTDCFRYADGLKQKFAARLAKEDNGR